MGKVINRCASHYTKESWILDSHFNEIPCEGWRQYSQENTLDLYHLLLLFHTFHDSKVPYPLFDHLLTLMLQPNVRHFMGNIFKYIFDEDYCLFIWMPLTLVYINQIDSQSAFNQEMAWYWTSDQSVPGSVYSSSLTQMSVTRPNLVKRWSITMGKEDRI